MSSADFLFSDGELSEYLSRRRKAMLEEIERYDRDRFLNSSDPMLLEYFHSKYSVEAPVIFEDALRADESEAQIDVSQDRRRAIRDRSQPFYRPGIQIRLLLPFAGERELLRYTPSVRYMGNAPAASADAGNIVFLFQTDAPDEQALLQWKHEVLSMTREYIGWVAADSGNFNRALTADATNAISSRRDRLLRGRGLVATLGVPLVQRTDAPLTYAVQDVVRRTVTPPPVESTPFQPEPALEDAQFEQILSLLRPIGATIERDPSAFEALDEESLRSLFLATLNSHYQGRATGETFNASGKTDILIRENDRNIFIAECKFWRGAKSLAAALDQVLSYATWRDGKLAILLFVRQKKFSDVLQQVPQLVRDHPSYRRGLISRAEAEWTCSIASNDDPGRERTLAVIAFHCPSE